MHTIYMHMRACTVSSSPIHSTDKLITYNVYIVYMSLYNSYTIMVLGIYGSKPTEPEGKVVYVAINP